MQVYVRERDPKSSESYRRRFHRSPECGQLRKGPARGSNHDTLKVDIQDLWKDVPCKTCFPDAPRVRQARRFCPKCNKRTARACAHNGGVPVFITGTTTYTSIFRDPGDEFTKLIYVWPDRAHRFYKHYN